MAVAYCWRSGQIEIGRTCPAGCVTLGKGPAKQLLDIIQGCARLAYDGKTWLVPGLPEAVDDDAAVEAVMAFQGRLLVRRPRRAA